MITCAVTEEDRRYMRHALDLARRAEGQTHPNPAVGCVILKGQQAGLPPLLPAGFMHGPRFLSHTCMPGHACKVQMAASRRKPFPPAWGRSWARGSTPEAGMPHAEVYALRAAGQEAQGATAYVSLEPCNHFGRTPPCSRAMVAAGVKRVGHLCNITM